MNINELSSIIEALIFASDDPIKAKQIAEILEISIEEIEAAMLELIKRYQKNGALEIRTMEDGYIIVVKQQYNEYIKLIKPTRASSLSRAALEVLSIVAFKQPVTKVEINDLRGVNSDGVVTVLLSKGLIEAVGRVETIGRPILYGTTKEFLEFFGLDSIEELPKPEDIKL
jgi:segregation and condensation protein B